MKIIFLLIPLNIVSIIALNAQNDQKMLIGGTFGFNFSNYDDSNNFLVGGIDKTVDFSTSPLVGYSITNNIMAGLALEYNTANVYYQPSQYLKNIKQIEFLISPFIRFYFKQSFFIQGQFNIGNTKQNLNYNKDVAIGDPNDPLFVTDLESKYFTLGYGIGLGYDINLSQNIKLEPLIRYVNNKYNEKDTDSSFKTSDIVLNLGLIFRY